MSVITIRPSTVPAGYPRGYERVLRLRDGRQIFVRPIVPADAPQLAWAIEHADADTLRLRFLGGPPNPTHDLLEHLTTVDYVRRFALVAGDVSTGQGVAVARYERFDDDTAEIAVVVDPGWRRAGVATALIEMLAEAALERGIGEFTASYLAANRPVAALTELAGETGAQRIKQGIAEFAVRLDRERLAGGKDAPTQDATGSG
jgi:RimJ/RimL family protein N-acetyltransferase